MASSDENEVEIPEIEPALGSIVEQGRGSLPFALIHGESLVACAAWALGDSGVTPLDLGHEWSNVAGAGETYVLHDPLCPLTPPWFIAECVARSQADQVVVVGVRPVTDTVKVVEDDVVGETADRDELVAVASPIVIPPAVLAGMPDPPGTDFTEIVTSLRADHEVVLLEAPTEARRVGSADDLQVLEKLTGPFTRPTG